jgi:hypothetical protein
VKRLVVCWVVCLASANTHADMSEAELLGTTAGRVLGAAQACQVSPERLQTTARLAFAAIDQLAKSDHDQSSANKRMRDGLVLGREDIKAERTSCEVALSVLGRLEKRVRERP